MGDLVAQRPGGDPHRAFQSRHAVDLRGMGAGDIDHDRGEQLLAAGQRHPLHAPTGAQDGADAGVETEDGTAGLGGALHVVAGELRVGDVAAAGEEDRARHLASRRLAEGGIVEAARGAEGSGGEHRQARPGLGRRQLPVGAADLVHNGQDALHEAVVAALHDDAAARVVAGHAAFVGDAAEALPIGPDEVALIGDGRTRHRGVVGPDDGAGIGGGAVARRRQAVESQGAEAPGGQFARHAGADDPRPDDDGVPVPFHGAAPCGSSRRACKGGSPPLSRARAAGLDRRPPGMVYRRPSRRGVWT